MFQLANNLTIASSLGAILELFFSLEGSRADWRLPLDEDPQVISWYLLSSSSYIALVTLIMSLISIMLDGWCRRITCQTVTTCLIKEKKLFQDFPECTWFLIQY